MVRVISAIVVLFLCLGAVTDAQVTEAWTVRNNGPGNVFDGINAMTLDAAGNIYVTGSSGNGAPAGVDLCTIKYTAAGDSVWVKRYNGTGSNTDIGRSIAVDAGGNVYVTGESRNGSSYGTEDYVTIKYSPDGDTLWVRRYDGTGGKSDFPTSLVLDDSANVYVTGLSGGSNNAMDITTIKYNTAGDEQWVQRWSGDATFAFSSNGRAMALGDSGYIYVTGNVNNQTTFWDFATLKYDRNGNRAWRSYYAGPSNNITEQSNAIAVDGEGNVYITGSSDGGTSGTDIVTVKYNAAGGQLWANRFAGGGIDDPATIAVDELGNVYVGGQSSADYITIKYDPSGDTVWTRTYNGTASLNDNITSLSVDKEGSVYVTGRSGGSGTNYDFVTIKYASNGDSVWSKRFNGPSNLNDEATVLRLGADGAVYVAGYSTGSGTGGDMFVIKYVEQPATGLTASTVKSPASFSLSQNYPNPFNPTTEIRFETPVDGFVSLMIYDVLGRERATLVNGFKHAGSYSVHWDAAGMASGVYLYRMQVNGISLTKKLVVER